ncbi:hypothetical protein N9903_00875 [bacterium]|nr:hypothetical protein [bacterium]
MDVPISIHEAFRTPFPKTYPLGGGKNAAGVHWDLGGHLEWGSEGRLTCATCHVVHGDEAEPPASGLLALDPVRESADEFCEGCHRGQRGDGQASPPWPNPGGTVTARTYHPCDDDIGNGAERLVETIDPGGWPFGSAESKPLICTTCHSPHGAAKGTLLLRPAPGGTGFCEACHDQIRLKNHHPVAGLQGNCFSALSGGPAGEGGGRMLCDSCHRAHNAGFDTEGGEEVKEEVEALYVPILREIWDAVEICAKCHPLDNPTCGKDPLYQASHFIGDPTLPETYDDPEPPLRTTAWPQSGLLSVYGGHSEKAITCLSCHTFKEKGVVSGDDGTAAHLLVNSGNMVEWEEGGEDNYLCTGCHTANPLEGGGSHPYMDAEVEKLGVELKPPVSITPNGHVNCDSCHRPHEAISSSGVYMLEEVLSENTDSLMIHPKIDFTPLCLKCHDSTKY